MQTAGIIGGSGFIGSWVTKIFLENNFKVKVSTTDISNKSKYVHLYDFKNAGNMEICALDILLPDTIKKFVDGCPVIVHGGTSFLLDVKDPQKELFEPTVTGTENFLEVIKNTAGLEKVIFIACVAAWNTSFPLNPATYSSKHIFTENDTPYFNENDHPYAQAKFIADDVVRDFIKEKPNLDFEMVTISPVMVIGNELSSRRDSTAISLQYLFKNKLAPSPFVKMLFEKDIPFSMVDVRNVAESIFIAANKKGLHGKNYLIANETYKVSDISRMLNHEAPNAAPAFTYSNALAKTDLGISFISVKETLNNYN